MIRGAYSFIRMRHIDQWDSLFRKYTILNEIVNNTFKSTIEFTDLEVGVSEYVSPVFIYGVETLSRYSLNGYYGDFTYAYLVGE